MNCPLCNIAEREPDNVIWENDQFVIVNCLYKKGHKERIMIVLKEHKPEISAIDKLYAMNYAIAESRKVFNYTYRFIVMDGTFGSIPDHWHYVITDLDPKSFDFYQILATHWLASIRTDLEFDPNSINGSK